MREKNFSTSLGVGTNELISAKLIIDQANISYSEIDIGNKGLKV